MCIKKQNISNTYLCKTRTFNNKYVQVHICRISTYSYTQTIGNKKQKRLK